MAFKNAGGDFKIKGVNEYESDPTRRKEEIIITDWLIGIFSQQGFFFGVRDVTHIVGQNMTARIWMYECYSVCPSLFWKHDELNGALLEVRETLWI